MTLDNVFFKVGLKLVCSHTHQKQPRKVTENRVCKNTC